LRVLLTMKTFMISRRSPLKTHDASELCCAFRAFIVSHCDGEARHKFPKR
jgi:hypothetical protein